MDPQTPHQWQEAVDAAHCCLILDGARQYGLITGGPDVDVERCQQILQGGERKQIFPTPDAIERFISAYVGGGDE